jgi:hypothetical protein
MKLTMMLSALALLAPQLAQAQELGPQGYPPYPQYPPYYPSPPPPYEAPPPQAYYEAPRITEWAGHTRVRVLPPYLGTVLMYDGQAIIGRFDRPGTLEVPSGRVYRLVALRGPSLVWSGYITASGQTIELRWPAEVPGRRRRISGGR